ncbi:MAG: condensin subunit E [Myxococcales bacterium]|nr:MAG: condensin subunit E [Myxococcales bacterium]
MDTETPRTFEDLAQVVEHELFPDVDLALRRGRHVDREDGAWYGFLTDAQAHLERFYRRYGAELVQRTDGFFFLLPSGDKLGRRHLSPSEMLVGQGLTLLYLEPATVEQGGMTTREQLLSQLSTTMGTEQLMAAFNGPKKKRMDERVAQESVRTRVSEAVRRLAGLGFVDLLPEERIRLRSSLMRFAEPVRGNGAELEALNRLVASGEISLTGDSETDGEDESGGETTVTERAPRRGAQAMPVTEWNEGSDWGASFEKEPSEEDSPPAEAEPEAEPAAAPVAPAIEPAPVIGPLPGDEEEWSYGSDEDSTEEELP